MKIKALIFDLDGTLLNTLVSINYYLNKTLESYGFGKITLDETKVFVGEGAAKLVVRALESQGYDTRANEAKVKEITGTYVADYDSAPDYLTAPYEGIPELLDELKKKGYKLGVVSNKPHSTVAPLVHKFFGGIFDFVIITVAGTAWDFNPIPY
jgi:phosphoglycolate phosphatase